MTAGFASDVGGSVTLAKTSWLVAPLRHADNINSEKIIMALRLDWSAYMLQLGRGSADQCCCYDYLTNVIITITNY